MLRFFLLFFLMVSSLSCSSNIKKYIVTTSAPLQDIISEIAGTRYKVINLLPPGVSPHTYQPKPSDAAKTSNSLVLFYISDDFDGWAAGLNVKNKIALLELVADSLKIEWPGGTDQLHKINPHFWLDPLAVKSILTGIAEKLTEAAPEGKDKFYKNAKNYSAKLDNLHKKLSDILSPVKGQAVITFHPSFNYMIKRYGLKYLACIEPLPGKEPTANYLKKIIDLTRKNNVRAIFTEPQIPDTPANVISDETRVPVYKLNPLGITDETGNYINMMINNAKILRKALAGGGSK